MHDAFVAWLRTTYCELLFFCADGPLAHVPTAEEECKRRRGHSDKVLGDVPSCPNVPDPTVPPGVTRDDVPTVDATPLPERVHSPTHSPPNNAFEQSAPETTTEDLPQRPPSATSVVASQPSQDPVVEAVQSRVTETHAAQDEPQPAPDKPADEPQDHPVVEAVQNRVTETHAAQDEPQPAPDKPADHEPQDQPTSKQPASENPSTPTATVPPPDNSAPVAGNLDCSTDHFTPVPTHPGAFQLEGSLTFLTRDTVEYWEKIPAGERWVNMVKAYLRFEHLSVSKKVRTRLLISVVSC